MQRLICAEEMEERIHAVYGLREPTKENMLAALERCHTIEAVPIWWLNGIAAIMRKSKSRAAASVLDRVVAMWKRENGEETT